MQIFKGEFLAIKGGAMSRFTHIAVIAVMIFTAGCSGGGGGGGLSSVTSLSQVEGVYQLTSAETSRTVDTTAQGIYVFVNGSYFSLYGKDDSCFDVGSVTSETLNDDGSITVTVELAASDGSVTSCADYLDGSLGVSVARNGQTHLDVSTIKLILWFNQNVIDKMVFYNIATGYQMSLFNLTSVALGNNVFATMTQLAFARAHQLMVAYMVSLLNSTTTTTGANDNPSTTTDTPSGDSGGTTSAPTTISNSCSGVTHHSGYSVITVCVKIHPPASGTEIDFGMTGAYGYGPATGSGLTDANGVACATFTIYNYGGYSWDATVYGETASTNGTINVDALSQSCDSSTL